MNLIDGKAIADEIKIELKNKIIPLDPKPGLAIILIGNDEASKLYVSLKHKACHEINMDFHSYLFPANAPEKDILETIDFLNKDPEVNGILVQLPLPPNFDEAKIIQAIDSKKDVDGFHPVNLELIEKNQPYIIPPLTRSILKMIESTGENVKDKNTVIIGNSDVFYRPLAVILKQMGANTSFCQPDAQNLNSEVKKADILIVAVGRPDFITKEMIKKDSLIIDIGTNHVNGKTVGDVNPNVDEICAFRSPVPGGVGPVTVAMLLQSTFDLYNKQNNK